MESVTRTIRTLLLVSFLLPAGLLNAVPDSNSYNPFSDNYSDKVCLVLPDGSDIAPAVMVLERACRGLEIPEAVSELFECVKRGKHMIDMEILLDALDGCQELLQNHHDRIEDDAVYRLVSDNLNEYSRALFGNRWNVQSAEAMSITTTAGNTNITIDPNGSGTLALGSADNTAVTADALAITMTSVNALTLTDGTASFALDGTGATTLSAASTVDLDCTGNMQINSSGGTIGLGNDAIAQNINIGTGAANRTITVGNTNGTTQVALKSGSGGVTITGALTPASADGAALGSAALEWSDLFLADGGIVYFGNSQDTTITHDTTTDGLDFKRVATGANTPMILTLQTGSTAVVVDDVIGAIDFQAPDEANEQDSILVAAGIEAISEGTFDLTYNATKLSFKTAASEVAAEKMALSSTGVLTLNGGSGAIIIPDAGSIGSASDTNAITIAGTGVVAVTNTTASSSASTGALTVGGGLGVAADIFVGDDLSLISDSAVLSLGADSDATLTHDGTTGLTIAATPISIDSTGSLDLSSTTGDINFQDGGVNQLALDLDGTAGDIIMKLMVDSDDFVFQQFDGTEVFRVEDNGDFDIAGGAGSSGVTVTAAGQLTADGRVIVDDATDATTTTDGSLQTDGGLSVAKDVVIGNDVKLLSDSAVLSLGLGSDATFTHDGTTGLTIAATPLTLTSSQAAADAVKLDASNAAGGITLTSGTGATGGITYTNDAATDFTAALVTGAMGHKSVSTAYDTSDVTTDGKTTVYVDWRLGNMAQVSALIDLSGIINTVGTDNDVAGFKGAGLAGEILKLPVGAKILHITANVVQLSNAAADMYSVYAHSGSVDEDAAGVGTELINAIEADSTGSTGVKAATLVGSHNELLRYLFLVNDGANTTSGATARTQGKILLTMVLALQQ